MPDRSMNTCLGSTLTMQSAGEIRPLVGRIFILRIGEETKLYQLTIDGEDGMVSFEQTSDKSVLSMRRLDFMTMLLEDRARSILAKHRSPNITPASHVSLTDVLQRTKAGHRAEKQREWASSKIARVRAMEFYVERFLDECISKSEPALKSFLSRHYRDARCLGHIWFPSTSTLRRHLRAIEMENHSVSRFRGGYKLSFNPTHTVAGGNA